MKVRISLAALILAAAFLTSCAPQWQKPGATSADFEAAQSACEKQALTRYPVLLRQVLVREGFSIPLSTRCSGFGATTRCATTGGQYEPPSYMPVDDNAEKRAQGLRDCLLEKGWRPAGGG